MDLQAQIERAGFPAGVEARTFTEPGGRVFRVTQGTERGLDILLTDDAVEMYGEGPTVATVLQRLREAVEEGLPTAGAPGEYVRQVFVGD